MAVTQVSEICLICKEKIEGQATFVGQVLTTTEPLPGLYTKDKPIKEGKLRIRHLTGGKPRGLICQKCTVEKLEN